VFNGMRNNVTIANLRPQIMACQEDVRRFEAAGTYLVSPALFEPTAILAVGWSQAMSSRPMQRK
jgi:hypothetical protein